jgi:hypothetical protein
MNRRFPAHVEFLLRHCAIGVLTAGLFLTGLLIFDINGFGTLVLGSAAPALAIAMTFVALAVTFGSAAMGAGIFLLSGGDRSRADAVDSQDLLDTRTWARLRPARTRP